MEKLEDLISNLEQFKDLKTVPIDQLLIDLSLIKEEFKKQLSMRVVSGSLSVGDCEELMYYGKLKDESVILDKGEKHLDYFLESTFELAEKSTRFDVKTAKKMFWDRVVALANYR